MDRFIKVSVLFILITVFTDLIIGEKCNKKDSCSCQTESSNFIMNLKSLSSPTNPRLIAEDIAKGYNYIYNPCDALTTVSCPGVDNKDLAVCQKGVADKKGYCAGTETSAEFDSGDLQGGSLNLKMECTDLTATTRKTSINIVCGDEDKLEFIKDDSTVSVGQYYLKLTTRNACIPKSGQSGFSVGSIMLLIFFILLIVYMIVGMLFMRYVRGATGAEMVPNLGFWKELPSLIKDGCVFVIKGCKADTTYTKI